MGAATGGGDGTINAGGKVGSRATGVGVGCPTGDELGSDVGCVTGVVEPVTAGGDVVGVTGEIGATTRVGVGVEGG